jgi:hypothetical protein
MDCSFYINFYPDLSTFKPNDTVAINEHYINVGMKEDRVKNKIELNELLSKLLHFDPDIFATTNLANDYSTNLKTKFNTIENTSWIDYFYSEPQGGLYNVPKIRVKNSNDIKECLNKWETIYYEIYKTIDFNLNFYKSFYIIPSTITNTRQLKIDWLKNGLFNKQYPNINALNNNQNVISAVQTILMTKFDLDIAYISTMKSEMVAYAKRHNIVAPESLTDDNDILLFLFFNTAQQLRLFFNNNERTQYINKNKNEYVNALDAVKLLKQKQLLTDVDTKYSLKEEQLATVVKLEGVPIVKNSFDKITSVLNIIKLSNSVYVDCFKKIYNSQNLAMIIDKIIKHEMTNYSLPILNSIELKIFVVSLVYNLFILEKVDKKTYMDFVKAKSIEILTALYAENNITDTNSIEKDVNHIIETKKIIKLTYLKNLIVKIVASMFPYLLEKV